MILANELNNKTESEEKIKKLSQGSWYDIHEESMKHTGGDDPSASWHHDA